MIQNDKYNFKYDMGIRSYYALIDSSDCFLSKMSLKMAGDSSYGGMLSNTLFQCLIIGKPGPQYRYFCVQC